MRASYTYKTLGVFENIEYRDVITCLYCTNSNYNINFNFFEISSQNIKTSEVRGATYYGLNNSEITPVYLKAALFDKDRRNQLIFGWISSEKIPFYMYYDIEAHEFYSNELLYFSGTYCKLIDYGFKIKYYPDTEEVIYTCIMENNIWTKKKANIFVETVDYGQLKNYTYKYNDCQFSGFSIIYDTDKKKYLIVSDVYVKMKAISMIIYLGILKIMMGLMLKKRKKMRKQRKKNPTKIKKLERRRKKIKIKRKKRIMIIKIKRQKKIKKRRRMKKKEKKGKRKGRKIKIKKRRKIKKKKKERKLR